MFAATSSAAAVHDQVTTFAAAHADRAPAVLDDAARRTAARIAVAEVQTHHAVWSMAQLRFEVHRALPVLPSGTDPQQIVDEVAALAVSAGPAPMSCRSPHRTSPT